MGDRDGNGQGCGHARTTGGSGSGYGEEGFQNGDGSVLEIYCKRDSNWVFPEPWQCIGFGLVDWWW